MQLVGSPNSDFKASGIRSGLQVRQLQFHVSGADEIVDAFRRNLADGEDRMRNRKSCYDFAALNQLVVLDAVCACKQRDAILEINSRASYPFRALPEIH